MRAIIYPHQMVSHGARALRGEFNNLGLRSLLVRDNGQYHPRPTDLIIGWGNSTIPGWENRVPSSARRVNPPAAIAAAVNKLSAFRKFAEAKVKTLPFTTQRSEAEDWIAKGHTVFGRQRLTGSQGEGIVLLNKDTEFVNCPLFTRFCKSDREYRVYVLNGKVIDYLQKKRPNGSGDLGIIRSASAGWVFCRTNIKELPSQAAEEAISAVAALGLQFGGVDLLWGNKSGSKILEINTSPGIEGVGVRKIAEAFINEYGEQQ